MTTDPIAAARALIAEADNPHVHGFLMTARGLRDMVATLADALEAERARVAAAYEAATEWLIEAGIAGDHGSDPLACNIRALTPADAQATLDKLLAEARLAGWRAGRDAAARSCVLSGQDLAEGDWGPEGRDMAVMLEARILALPEPKEASHD